MTDANSIPVAPRKATSTSAQSPTEGGKEKEVAAVAAAAAASGTTERALNDRWGSRRPEAQSKSTSAR